MVSVYVEVVSAKKYRVLDWIKLKVFWGVVFPGSLNLMPASNHGEKCVCTDINFIVAVILLFLCITF
jgi:hypothetical protein